MSDPVVVFGASSWIGGHAIRTLLDTGHRVVGVARRPEMARILLPEESTTFSIVTADQVPGSLGRDQCTILNFAYVKEADPGRMYRQNRRLFGSIAGVAKARCRRFVHISTAAVFGYRFAEPPRPERVARPPDDAYGESKLHAERLAERLARRSSCELAIVRLGNVIGPGSPAWMAGLAQRIMEVKPVAYAGSNGFANATHVDNIADYIATLVDLPAGALEAHGTYHHLAEYSSRRWPELLDVIGSAVGHQWTAIGRPADTGPKRGPLRQALKATYRSRAGRYVRSGLGLVPDPGLERINAWARYTPPPHLAPVDAVGGDDAGLLEVLSVEHEFGSHTVPGWSPRVDFDAACDGIAEWIATSRFTVKPS